MTSVDASSRHMAWKSSWFGGVVIQDAAANGYVRPLKSYVREEGCHVGWESEEEEEREEERKGVQSVAIRVIKTTTLLSNIPLWKPSHLCLKTKAFMLKKI